MTTAILLDGISLSSLIRKEITAEVTCLKERGIQPGLAAVLVGEDAASQVYVNSKHKTCLELGFYSEVHRLPVYVTQEQLLKFVHHLNTKPLIHGILIQLPLPIHIDEKIVIDAIAVEKDVDGFHPLNVGKMAIGDDSLLPCTPAGIIKMLKYNQINIMGKHAVVIGRSNIVGKPISFLLQREHATVTMCHSHTVNMKEITRQADILIVAIGRSKFIDHTYIKPGVIIIDVGMNRLNNGELIGDVDFNSVKEICSAITPVPGGVGPMTITMLMLNTLQAAKRIHHIGAVP